MEISTVKLYLCSYDKRNPDCTADDEEIEYHKKTVKIDDQCFCDNCFYGRTKLAEEILKILET